MVDFLTLLYPNSNEIRFLFYLVQESTRLDLEIGISFEGSEMRHIIFKQVSNFQFSFCDEESLPHSIIGFDYWDSNSGQKLYEWELNSDSCTWNFRAPFPEIEEIIGESSQKSE
ncbi:MAG: hypothetical protein KJ069_04815 [Anaerolineae bacterium]|nr:hypothetical protein [Anaerolineae bacterium]